MRGPLYRTLHRSMCALLIGLGSLMAACSEERPTQSEKWTSPPLRLKPLPNEQAELVALWLGGEIEAPLPLYERVLSNLEHIGAIAPFPQPDSFAFMSPRIPSTLILDLYEGGRDSLISGASPIWDSLLAIFNPTIQWFYQEWGETATLTFPGRLNSEVLETVFNQVPEVEYAVASSSLWQVGKWRRSLYAAWIGRESVLYTFHSGTGPGPIGYETVDTVYCFLSTEDQMEYWGRWIPSREPLPEWAPDLCTSLRRFVGLRWCIEGLSLTPGANLRLPAELVE